MLPPASIAIPLGLVTCCSFATTESLPAVSTLSTREKPSSVKKMLPLPSSAIPRGVPICACSAGLPSLLNCASRPANVVIVDCANPVSVAATARKWNLPIYPPTLTPAEEREKSAHSRLAFRCHNTLIREPSMDRKPPQVTQLLREWSRGNDSVFAELSAL